MQQEFAERYQAKKPDKRLHWVHQLGSVHIAVHVKDRVIKVTATPLEAAIVELFSEKRERVVLSFH